MPETSLPRLEYLFKRYVDGVCTEEENGELLDFIRNAKNDIRVKELMDQVWSRLNADYRLSEEQSERILTGILQPFVLEKIPVKKSLRINLIRWSAAAAVLLVIIATFGLLYKRNNRRSSNRVAIVTRSSGDITPGGNKAVLTLSNGKKIILDSVQNGSLLGRNSNYVIKVNNGLLKFSEDGIKNKEQGTEEYNTISTPRGGQYQVILPDGSKVWLNAASSLRFPTAFAGKVREVQLAGEAYFEIAPNKDMPFKVEVNHVEVKVLGTHFDVMAYSDEPAIRTTLLEGEVEVSKGNNRVVLKPGQQASSSLGSDRINVNVADVEQATAWKDGLFFFHSTNIQSVLHQIARWYDVKVVYKGETNAYLNGMISRNTELSQVLHMLEVTSNLKFIMEGREVIVKQADQIKITQ